VRVESAPGSGDDHMVGLVAGAGGRPCLVVTADRELRRRVTELGAEVAGPRTVRP
jgi:rRNA-processing protein FCF1